MAFGSFEVGVIQRTPVPSLNDDDKFTLARLVSRARRLVLARHPHRELPRFHSARAVTGRSATLANRIATLSDRVRTIEAELAMIQAEIDSRCFDLYGIGEADRRAIVEGFGGEGKAPAEEEGDPDGESSDEAEESADSAALAAELVSWAVGVAFSRFDIRLATDAPHDAARARSVRPAASLPGGHPRATTVCRSRPHRRPIRSPFPIWACWLTTPAMRSTSPPPSGRCSTPCSARRPRCAGRRPRCCSPRRDRIFATGSRRTSSTST